jgi:hypothetical protein
MSHPDTAEASLMRIATALEALARKPVRYEYTVWKTNDLSALRAGTRIHSALTNTDFWKQHDAMIFLLERPIYEEASDD